MNIQTSFSKICIFEMIVVKSFCVWCIWSVQLVVMELSLIVKLWNFGLVVLLIKGLSMELFCCLSKVRFEKGVYLRLRLDFLIVG